MLHKHNTFPIFHSVLCCKAMTLSGFSKVIHFYSMFVLLWLVVALCHINLKSRDTFLFSRHFSILNFGVSGIDNLENNLLWQQREACVSEIKKLWLSSQDFHSL